MKILSIDIGTKNFAYCILDGTVITHWEVINLKASTARDATSSMINTFNNRQYVYDVDVVLIESQEAATSKMKRISNAVQSHFETVRIYRQFTKYSIEWSSGDVKLRVYKGPEIWKPLKARSGYSHNKKLGVEHTKALLHEETENESFYKWFMTLGKKDDAADCYLQAKYRAMCHETPQITVKKRCRIPIDVSHIV